VNLYVRVCGINDPGHTCDEYFILLVKSGMTSTPGTVGRRLWPKTPGYHRFPPAAYLWGTIHPVPGNNPTPMGWRGGPTNLKRTNRGDEPRHHSCTLRSSAGGRDVTTRVPYIVTREGDLGLCMPGGSPLRISIAHCRSWVASVLSTGHDGMQQ
jgi:hypothetical protein